jgi:hypothetical protein
LRALGQGIVGDKMILLGTHYERKAYFAKARYFMFIIRQRMMVMKCLGSFDFEAAVRSDLDWSAQLVIASSNLQILHTSFLKRFSEEVVRKQPTLRIQALVQLLYSLRKIDFQSPEVLVPLVMR